MSRWAPLLLSVLGAGCSAPRPHVAPIGRLGVDETLLMIGDPSMFHADAFAPAGRVEAPIVCDRATGASMIVVHGQGHRHWAVLVSGECRAAGAEVSKCPYLDENGFWADLHRREPQAMGGMDCGDRPIVGGLFDPSGWPSAEALVRGVEGALDAWDLDEDVAVFVVRPFPVAQAY